ncbi:hypothetical protein [uncultured Stenotrophomonas sp.]|uniref:hypothetical protein n=1 Tax=uncultured Stenotrophomonas sp. TaxID=165438 RepID=UPI0025F0A874|nr:hypothetical protein [uncultured Stenotrophomonas sp.]
MSQRDFAGAGRVAAVIFNNYRDLSLYTATALADDRPKLARPSVTISATAKQITINDATEFTFSRSTFEK